MWVWASTKPGQTSRAGGVHDLAAVGGGKPRADGGDPAILQQEIDKFCLRRHRVMDAAAADQDRFGLGWLHGTSFFLACI